MAPSNNSYSTGAGKCLVIKIKKQKESEVFICLLLSRTDPEKEVEGFEKEIDGKEGFHPENCHWSSLSIAIKI